MSAAIDHFVASKVLTGGASYLQTAYRTPLSDEVTLYISPGTHVDWDTFRASAPKNSIALDGFVNGPPELDASGKYCNADHHTGVDRLATRATCAQVFLLLRSGLLEAFTTSGKITVNSFCNDADQDTCASNWSLVNNKLLTQLDVNPRVEEFLRITDRLDTTSGYYRINPASKVMREMAWVNQPYVEARMAGKIPLMSGKEMADIISAVGERITAFVEDRAFEIDLNSGFKIIGGDDSWKMITETGYYARTILASEGVNAFVSYRGQDSKGHHYTLGRLNKAIRFPIPDLYTFLNFAENRDKKFGEWNGGDTTGGSSRGQFASQFAPEELENLIKLFLRKEAQMH